MDKGNVIRAMEDSERKSGCDIVMIQKIKNF